MKYFSDVYTNVLTNVKQLFEVGVPHMIIQCFGTCSQASILCARGDLVQD